MRGREGGGGSSQCQAEERGAEGGPCTMGIISIACPIKKRSERTFFQRAMLWIFINSKYKIISAKEKTKVIFINYRSNL